MGSRTDSSESNSNITSHFVVGRPPQGHLRPKCRYDLDISLDTLHLNPLVHHRFCTTTWRNGKNQTPQTPKNIVFLFWSYVPPYPHYIPLGRVLLLKPIRSPFVVANLRYPSKTSFVSSRYSYSKRSKDDPVPICSMYSIFTYIWFIYGGHVGKVFQHHGAYGGFQFMRVAYFWMVYSGNSHLEMDDWGYPFETMETSIYKPWIRIITYYHILSHLVGG